MEVYKLLKDSAIFSTTNDPKYISGEKASRILKKGEFVIVKKKEDLIDKNLSFPYTKYTLLNNNWLSHVAIEGITEGETIIKASFVDVPEYLFMQVKKPKVYITLGIILTGLAIWSIIDERKNN
jgi:hypothetical protein